MQEGGCVQAQTTEEKPAAVPARAKQAGEVRARWPWVKPEVWTERMLTALEEGVKGGKWFSLIDKVFEPGTLRLSFGSVKENNGAPGEDHQTIEMFEAHLEGNLSRLAEELKSGRYRPRAIQRKYIPKPGSQEKRPLGIPTVRDRVVQGAIRMAIEPIFERDFHEGSYGFRPGRRCKDALRRVNRLLQEGYTWVVDADLKSYFDTIPHERLLKLVADKVADGRILELVEAFLKQQVMEAMKSWTPESGTPQGAVLSPLLSNIYLDPMDHHMAREEVAMVRYADDFVILCRSKQEALEAWEMAKEWTAGNGLTLHPEKTRVVDATQKGGFDFLGYHFERAYRWPRQKSLHKLKDTIRGKTKRNNGHSLQKIILDVSATLAGWFEYFKHSHRTTFKPLDQWIRMRLRSILRKRQGGQGRGRGSDHQRWPNAFFAKLGLFSLAAAHAEARQSSQR
jgi:RNA-directed DNA polymerase